MAYRLEISKLAQKDLAKLDKVVLEAIRKRLKRLAETADDIAHLPLKGPLKVSSSCGSMISIESSMIGSVKKRSS
jgi:mRNA-degrading endonuclease RelE of RelBE toxin-antitoxin system